jgi:hypothetical protein
MGTLAYTDASIVLNSVNLSDHCKSLTINYEAEMLDDTVMGDTTRSSLAGLLNWSIDVDFLQDYAASKVDATLFALVGAAAFVTVVKPTSGSVSATNPSFTGTGVLEKYPPMAGGVGDLETVSITIRSSGTLVRATS